VAYVRKVRTASGAVAVQVVRKHRGQREILAHVGSAHTDAELGILLERARRIAAGDQEVLDIELPVRSERVADIADWRAGMLVVPPAGPKGAPAGPGRTAAASSRLLYEVIGAVYDWLGFDVVADPVYRDLVIARIVEPTSKAEARRVLGDLGGNSDVLQDDSASPRVDRLRWLSRRDRRQMLCSRFQPRRAEPAAL